MFLSRRSTQAEYFDAERPLAELQQFYRSLAIVNSLFMAGEPFQRYIPRLVGQKNVHNLSLLDLGAGDGSLGRSLTLWAARRGWTWRVVNVDMNAEALGLNGSGQNIAGSVLALPFQDSSFDVVIASQMTHHLDEAAVPQHLREAWRVARQAILISDLHRNTALYMSLWIVFLFARFPESFRTDGVLSVKRAWRVNELRGLAHSAGISDAKVHLYFGARTILQARKPLQPVQPLLHHH
jgi:ubiquinone/menaquinone biosynthesis C-methylase UbiE